MEKARDSVVRQHVERSRALRRQMHRSGEKVVRGLRRAAASVRRAGDPTDLDPR